MTSIQQEKTAVISRDPALTGHTIREETGHKNMLQLIHLRWMAVAGQILTISVSSLVFEIELPVFPMWLVLILLITFNMASHLRWHEEKVVKDTALSLALLVDVLSLAAQLYFSGGTNNPFVFLFLLQVILGAVLLRRQTAWLVVLLTSVCVGLLSELHVPLQLNPDSPLDMDDLYRVGLIICFVLNSGLLVFFVNRVSTNLRAGDALLAKMTQRAAEEEHIVRMGLLASGAAHELGTPMATMSVILGDWRQDKLVMDHAILREDVEELQTQLLRCKRIVSGILMSAGETREESARQVSLSSFLKDCTQTWCLGRSNAKLDYRYEIDRDYKVVFDSAVRQMLFNLLDNAADSEPESMSMRAYADQENLVLTIEDQGPGFSSEVLDMLGKPYNSTKNKAGGGLGLFLVVNVARTLGGTVQAGNLPDGGAQVTVTLPLSSIVVPEKPNAS